MSHNSWNGICTAKKLGIEMCKQRGSRNHSSNKATMISADGIESFVLSAISVPIPNP